MSEMASSPEGKVIASLLREDATRPTFPGSLETANELTNVVWYGNELRPASNNDHLLMSSPRVCSLCDDIAVSKCQTCEKYLCADCKLSHKKQRESRIHEVENIDFFAYSISKRKCLEHSDCDVSYFCDTCIAICCGMCITDNHESHSYRDVNKCIDVMKDMCQDMAKKLRIPFGSIQDKHDTIDSAHKKRINSYKEIRSKIMERKQYLIDLITNVTDDEHNTISKTESEAEQFIKMTKSDLVESQSKCELALAPVMSIVMGNDISKIINCIQNIQSEIRFTNIVLQNVNKIETFENIAFGNADKEVDNISDAVKSFLLAHRLPNILKSIAIRCDGVLGVANEKPITLESISLAHSSDVVHLNAPVKKFITAIQYLHKSRLQGCCEISKHICYRKFLRQHFDAAYIMSYVDNAVDITKPLTPLPTTSHSNGRTILTIDESRHVIASTNRLNLCSSTGVIQSVKYGDDYIPDSVSYYIPEKFVSICCNKRKIRYYSSDNLSVISTHQLDIAKHTVMKAKWMYMLVTENQDILIPAKANKRRHLIRFTKDGRNKGIVPMNDALFQCKWSTVCMIKQTQILAANDYGTIYRFNLVGDSAILGRIEGNIKNVWSMGVDDNDVIYVSYATGGGNNWIAKYKLT